jgi:hypothetical protein
MVLPGATLAPDCGGLYGLAGRAFCVSAPLAGISALAEAYVADLQTRGWIAGRRRRQPRGVRASARRRRLRRAADAGLLRHLGPAGPASLGYLGFGPIPGDVCAAQPAAAPAATVPPAQ